MEEKRDSEGAQGKKVACEASLASSDSTESCGSSRDGSITGSNTEGRFREPAEDGAPAFPKDWSQNGQLRALPGCSDHNGFLAGFRSKGLRYRNCDNDSNKVLFNRAPSKGFV